MIRLTPYAVRTLLIALAAFPLALAAIHSACARERKDSSRVSSPSSEPWGRPTPSAGPFFARRRMP